MKSVSEHARDAAQRFTYGAAGRCVAHPSIVAFLSTALLIGCERSAEAPSQPSQPLQAEAVSIDQAIEIEALQALGYVEGDEAAPEGSGVLLYDRSRVEPCFNLYTSEHAARIFLLDMEGVLLHMWEMPPTDSRKSPKLRRAKLLENGELLALMEGRGLVRLDRDSRVLWRFLEEGMKGDVFHSNTLEVLDGRHAARHPAFRKRNILTSWRSLDAIGIIDVEASKVVWDLEGLFHMQHDPTLLDRGTLLVFDNFDLRRGEKVSRVVEVDPVTRSIAWEFTSSDAFPFFTRSGGASAELPNGNILISETRKGRAFEVTRDGEVVWIYANPARVSNSGEKIARLFEMQRLPADTPLAWLTEQNFAADVLTKHTKPGR